MSMGQLKKKWKRSLAGFLSLCLFLTSFNMVSWADVQAAFSVRTATFIMNGSDFKEAAQAAVDSGEILNFEDLELSAKKDSQIEDYEKLFTKGSVYEFFPSYELGENENAEDLDLRMFLRTPKTDSEDEYFLSGDEDIIFLYVNGSAETVNFRSEIDGVQTKEVEVKSYAMVFGEDETKVTVPGPVVPETTVPETTAPETSTEVTEPETSTSAEETLEVESSETETSETEATAEETEEVTTPEETSPVEETTEAVQETESEAVESTPEETEAATEEKTEAEEPETEALETETSTEAQLSVSANHIPVVATSIDSLEDGVEPETEELEETEAETEEKVEPETEKETEETEKETEVVETTTGAESVVEIETQVSTEAETSETSETLEAAESVVIVETGEDDNNETSATETTTAAPSMDYEWDEADLEDGKELINDLEPEETAPSLEELKGKTYDIVSLGEADTARAFVISLKYLLDNETITATSSNAVVTVQFLDVDSQAKIKDDKVYNSGNSGF